MANTEGVLPLIRVAKTPHKDVIIRASSANSLRGNPLVVHAAPHATARAAGQRAILPRKIHVDWTRGSKEEGGLPAQNGTAELDLFMGIFHCGFYCPEGPKSQAVLDFFSRIRIEPFWIFT